MLETDFFIFKFDFVFIFKCFAEAGIDLKLEQNEPRVLIKLFS